MTELTAGTASMGGADGRPASSSRTRWTELRAHNRHDCAGMREVCLLAARELEAAGAEE